MPTDVNYWVGMKYWKVVWAPNATVMSWRGTEGGMKAVDSGHMAIMSPGEFCLF